MDRSRKLNYPTNLSDSTGASGNRALYSDEKHFLIASHCFLSGFLKSAKNLPLSLGLAYLFSVALTWIMLPLQTARIYDYQQPTAETPRQEFLRAEQLRPDQARTDSHQILEERRQLTDRRATERREKQHAIFLNTRKIQGRRRSAGRRLSDNLSPYRPISLKG